MNLLTQTGRHLRWFATVWRRLLVQTPLAAPATVVLLVMAQLAQVVAFLLPLKVILLVGGNGIPRYFSGFVSPEHKDAWILGLCLGAIALYGLSLLADWLADRQSRKGAQTVLDNTRKITLFNDQGEGVREHYRRVCEVIADGAIVVVGLAVGLYLFPVLFMFVAVIILLMYAFTALLALMVGDARAGRIERWLATNHGGFLRTLSAIGFLAGFLFLVAAFYRMADPNLLIAIISLILSRRIFQAATSFIGGLIKLAGSRERVDALFFHEKQLLASESRDGRRFWQMFVPELRAQRSAQRLRHSLSQDIVQVSSHWRDSGQAGVPFFDIGICHEPGQHAEGVAKNSVLEKIYFPRQRSQASHEVYLLQRVDTEALYAPPLIDHGQMEEFAFIHLRNPPGASPSRKAWERLHPALVLTGWSYAPPGELVDVYLRSQPLLWSRMETALFRRLHLAADESVQRETLDSFMDRLGDMQKRLRALPLFIHNPELNARNVLVDEAGTPCIVNWGRWTLEPIGVGATAQQLEVARKGALLDELRDRRRVPAQVVDADLLLAAHFHELEKTMVRQQYQKALQQMARLLDETHPILDQQLLADEADDSGGRT